MTAICAANETFTSDFSSGLQTLRKGIDVMNNTNWVSMWGNAMSIAEHHPESYAKDLTLRYPVYAPFSGERLRFTFDNYCGKEPVTITKATVARSASDLISGTSLSCPVQADTLTDITFDGQTSVTLQPQESVVSDAVPLPVTAGSTLCVSIYFSGFTLMQSAVLITGPLSKGYFSLGDVTTEPALPLETTKTTGWFYFLSNIDILTDAKNHAVICYGDSITAQSWPDYLTLRLKENGYAHTSVIRRAASGTRVLRQYSCITYDSYGLKGSNRFCHEIPTAGADTLIIQQGINDIIHPVGASVNSFRPMSDLPSADELIDGLKWYIGEARKLNISVYLGTLLPIFGWRTYAPFREELRSAVNEWIRTTTDADGCIDFDRALRCPDNPLAFREGFDSGDHLHPSEDAYREMAACVPAELFHV